MVLAEWFFEHGDLVKLIKLKRTFLDHHECGSFGKINFSVVFSKQIFSALVTQKEALPPDAKNVHILLSSCFISHVV